ncbi:hypothetical protein CSOJ01_06411 [Colletotrichum sojae]|uniref:Uncharacterized protein n=1 Tax=Colletotrichum sojae TaxID=2175907 RepID=A0A8H6JC63_9PEZI|nr:hypothetical protein CSOJ01_06411 [Colletotrichum sojae]
MGTVALLGTIFTVLAFCYALFYKRILRSLRWITNKETPSWWPTWLNWIRPFHRPTWFPDIDARILAAISIGDDGTPEYHTIVGVSLENNVFLQYILTQTAPTRGFRPGSSVVEQIHNHFADGTAKVACAMNPLDPVWTGTSTQLKENTDVQKQILEELKENNRLLRGDSLQRRPSF